MSEGGKLGIIQRMKAHPVRVALTGAGALLVGAATILANVGTFLDTETGRSAKNLLLPKDQATLATSSRPTEGVASGLTASPPVALTTTQPDTPAGSASGLTISGTGNSATRDLAASLSAPVRRTVLERVSAPLPDRVAVRIEGVSFVGGDRRAEVAWSFKGNGVDAQCAAMAFTFFNNNELAQQVAQAVATSVTDSMAGGTAICG